METLLQFLQRLESRKIWYRMSLGRDAVMVLLSIPGERWEVEFFPDGQVEVERFVSTGQIEDEQSLPRLFEKLYEKL
jgi:hypothetical protein